MKKQFICSIFLDGIQYQGEACNSIPEAMASAAETIPPELAVEWCKSYGLETWIEETL